jgi:hypothetical protein
MKYTLISLLFLSGCAALQSDVSLFREQAAQCPGHVKFMAEQANGEQTMRMECEWEAAPEVEG